MIGSLGRRAGVPARLLYDPRTSGDDRFRHFCTPRGDKRGRNYGNEQNPSAGYIAWLLWGGDEGRAWALDLKRKIGNAPDI